MAIHTTGAANNRMTYFVVGLLGIFLYTSIFGLAASCYHHAINRYTRRIFLLLSLFCLLELPMYYHLAIEKRFGGVTVYAINMFSSVCYFGMFSFVCFAWGDVLRAKNLEILFEAQRRQQMRNALAILNVMFGAFVCVMAVMCVSRRRLDVFLNSDANLLFVTVDAFKNILIGIFILQFGNSLRARLQNYCGAGAARGGIIRIAISENNTHLMRVCQKLLILVWICVLSFLLKVIAIFVYRSTSAPSEYSPPENLKNMEVMWWIIFEFIPVAVPALSFIFTMGWPSRILDKQNITFPDHTTSVVNGLHLASDNEHMASVDSDLTASSNVDVDEVGQGLSAAAQMILQQRASLVHDNDCFHIMERLSSMSADLVDIELGRDSEFVKEFRKSLKLNDVQGTAQPDEGGEGGMRSRSLSAMKSFFSSGK